jgi:hypothetical protein
LNALMTIQEKISKTKARDFQDKSYTNLELSNN